MNSSLKNTRILLVVVGVLLFGSLALGFSYALWQVTRTQTTTNTLSSACFDVTMVESGGVSLTNAYPMVDADGMDGAPYQFTITNICDIYTEYQVDLETLASATIAPQNIKAVIDSGTPKVLSAQPVVEKTIAGALDSRKIFTGGLASGSSATHELRIWLDEATSTLEASGKIYEAKVVVVAVPSFEP